MRNYADKVNLHARIHALRGRLLMPADYASLIRTQQANALPPSPSPSPASDLTGAKEALFREQIAPVVGLALAYGRYAPLFLAYLRQFEVHNLSILLMKAAGRQGEQLWYDISPFAILQKDLLKRQLSLTDIRSLVAGSYLNDDFKDVSGYRRMEIDADICAAGSLYHFARFLSGENKSDFQNMMQRRIAVLTVLWSYRLRWHYHFSEEKIERYMRRFHDLFDGGAKSHFRLIEDVQNRYLEQLRKEGGEKPSAADIERHLEKIFFTWVSSMFHRNFHSICCVLAYLWLLHYQIRNLFRIIDGRRFGFSAEVILDRLIC